MARLSGKTALITGAASGIGRAIAVAYAREGASVYITDVDEGGLKETAEAAKAHGGQVLTAAQDVTDEARWDAVVEEAQEKLGALDCLVNNAGIAVGGPIVTMDLGRVSAPAVGQCR